MPDEQIGTALTVLRVIRGWNQEELASAAGIRSGTVSDYERGKMVPGFTTLQRLLDVMGYPLSALDRTQSYIGAVKADRLAVGAEAWELDDPAVLRREMEQVSAEAGRVVSRLTRLMFVLISSPPGPPEMHDLEASEEAVPTAGRP